METAYIGIGSNIGDLRRNCLAAIDRIGALENCKILSTSRLYVTEPVGVSGQEWYLNGVVSVVTGLPPFSLLDSLLAIEAEMGRFRITRWEPRVIDLDILLFGQKTLNDNILTVPHPLMHKRRFVMAPMAELAPDLIHPVLHKTMLEILNEIPGEGQVIKYLEGK
jgi:2-amino-4-hydroxy-6-hydroxymethyldihydropteridine diphosphokinase